MMFDLILVNRIRMVFGVGWGKSFLFLKNNLGFVLFLNILDGLCNFVVDVLSVDNI